MRTICRLRETVDQIQKGFTASDRKGDDINFREKGEMPRSSLPKQKTCTISSELNSMISTDLIEICSETGGHQLHVFVGVSNELK